MLSVRDVMTAEPITIAPEATLRDAVELLTANGVSGLPVLASGRVVGTLSARDIISFECGLPGVPMERDDEDVWQEGTVVFSDDNSVSPASYFAELWEDAGADVSERFRCADTPEWDFLREHTVQEAMSQDILYIAPAAPIQVAAEYMKRSGAHRMLVTDATRLVGIVTTMDITRAVAEYRLHEDGVLTADEVD